MIRFGFELEGFYRPGVAPVVPPENYPTDGFPGLVELRTVGPHSLEMAYANLMCEYIKFEHVDYSTSVDTFGAEARAVLRRRYSVKEAWDIRSLYNKAPRLLGNKVIASFQINLSNLMQEAFTNKEGFCFPTRWGLLDIPKIVRNLDDEFASEIKEAKRQPGEYSVKNDIRLEYRSLPNFAFETNPTKAKIFLNRIENCLK